MIISIHVRYVPKDLWVQTSSTSSASTTSEGNLTSDKNPGTTPLQQQFLRTRDPSHFNSDTDWHQQESLVPSRNHRSSRSGQDDDSFNDQESIDDDEAELRAEELIGSDMFGQSPSARIGAAGVSRADSINQGLRGLSFATSRVRDNSHGSHSSDHYHAQPPLTTRPTVKQHHQQQHQHQGQQQHALSQQQLSRLISYSTRHKNDGHGLTISSEKHGKDGLSAKRFSNIPGWANYRSRQNSNNSKHIDREVLNHGGVLADHCLDEENPAITEERKSECTAWKACFGLFWLAAGHWLDDSRLVSSYNLQPHCLLELQLKNNYIQLPPPGTPLNYCDHYAEGLLYKKSKKNKLGQGNRECAGDTTKKTQELTPPLTVLITAIPQNARHSLKLTSSSMTMSSSMISVLTSQDPTAPVVCLRASSESSHLSIPM
ncbi:hypothetical protein BGZ96_010997 [Linnemannia gamsii]|uniref:Uncharacterized protein n=1 Tax=Linnemannia gamsii TaxID=64522 RepID=A0ABQ7JTI3_9FUNG|nr:hypothetical protein BGZ96_010997 [Linnemannia gamsii]